MKNFIIKTFAIISFLFIFTQCKTSSTLTNSEGKTLYIASETKDCTGVAPMKCLQVKEKLTDQWGNFYSNIEGFTYEPGFEYELKVKSEKLENVPADGSSLRYVLVKEVSKVKK